jgi:sterol desaturase/sphingolipid hydroxylase (fatty acid hydroxylase superfamily)
VGLESDRRSEARFTTYLHHKYYECNYADGVVPLDKWFGTFHDGSREAQEAMDRRFRERTRSAEVVSRAT